jgi:N-acetylmuramoyl-L-alanine amidase
MTWIETKGRGMWKIMVKHVGMSFFTFVAVFIVLFSYVGNSQAATQLSDIPSTAAKEINFLLDEEIVTGYEDGTFKPTKSVTRAEAAIMLGRALDLDGTQRPTSFSDVNASAKASGYIESAVKEKIISGYEDGTYKPGKSISRVEMAYLLVKGFELTETSNVNFPDVPKTGNQYEAINKIATAGITVGYSDGTYKPTAEVTRQDFAVFVARAVNPEYRIAKVKEPIKDEEPIKTAYVKVASWDVLNVRSGPSSNHSIVGKLKLNDQVSVYRYEGDWAYIKSGNITGYVNSYYLSSSKVIEAKNKITIDAGHGGTDPGASGNGIIEEELTLDMAKRVERLLKEKGIEVVMTRTTDVKPSFSDRVQTAVNSGSDAFVSIHGNAAVDSRGNGTETWYSSDSKRASDSEKLAEFIQNRLYKALDTKDRGVKDGGFYVIKRNSIPAVLVELGFMTNKADASKLKSNSYREEAAKAITQGIVDYFNWKD